MTVTAFLFGCGGERIDSPALEVSRAALDTSGFLINTVAGSAEAGLRGDGGPAIAASLNAPRGVAALPDGGFLIADTNDNVIRRALPNGTIATVAGGGTAYPGDGGNALEAALDFPFDVAPTADGGFLIVDQNHQRVCKVSASGIITTVAGNGSVSFAGVGDGGRAIDAALVPVRVAPLADGGFLLAEAFRRVRRISSDGIISTVAGNGDSSQSGILATEAELSSVNALAAFDDGGFLIGDVSSVKQVDAHGIIHTLDITADPAASPDEPQSISWITDLALAPDGGFFIANSVGPHEVLYVDTGYVLHRVAGTGVRGFSGDGGLALSAQIEYAEGVDATADGSLLIADSGNDRIRRVHPPGELASLEARTCVATQCAGLDGTVVDAYKDTLTVGFADQLPGRGDPVRLLGITAPRTDECFGPEGRAFVRSLTQRKPVTISFDAAVGVPDEESRYGKLLGYADIAGADVALQMILGGFARVDWRSKNTPRFSREDDYLAAQALAMASGRGGWGACAWAVSP